MECFIQSCKLEKENKSKYCRWHTVICRTCQSPRWNSQCLCINNVSILNNTQCVTQSKHAIFNKLKVWLGRSSLSATFQQRVYYVMFVISYIYNDDVILTGYLKHIKFENFIEQNCADAFSYKDACDELLKSLMLQCTAQYPRLHDQSLVNAFAMRPDSFVHQAHKFINLPELFHDVLYHINAVKRDPFSTSIELPDFDFAPKSTTPNSGLSCLGCFVVFKCSKKLREHHQRPALNSCRMAYPKADSCNVCHKWFMTPRGLRAHMSQSVECNSCVIIPS